MIGRLATTEMKEVLYLTLFSALAPLIILGQENETIICNFTEAAGNNECDAECVTAEFLFDNGTFVWDP